MIRFVIWAMLKDYKGWKASEVLFGGRHASDYVRWKAMKLVYEKDLSIYARWKAMKLVYKKDWSIGAVKEDIAK